MKRLSPIRSFLQLGGKRRELPRVRIEVRYGTGRQIVTATSSADLLSKAFVFKRFTDPRGVERTIAFVAFDPTVIEPHKLRYQARNPDAPLNEIPGLNVEDIQFWAEFDFEVFADSRCLRMIAKIAFEWWCKERSPEFLTSNEYNAIRNYIRYGTLPDLPIVSLLDDAAIAGYFSSIPFGAHLLYRRTHPRLQSLVMVVAPYSLTYYQVVLAHRYRALASETALTAVNPQTGEAYTPRLVNPRGTVLTVLPDQNYSDAREVIRRHSSELLKRLNNGIRAFIDQSQRNPVGGGSA